MVSRQITAINFKDENPIQPSRAIQRNAVSVIYGNTDNNRENQTDNESSLTCDALAVHGGHVLELGLLDRVPGDRAARERSVRGEGAVDVADAVATGRRAVDALELHGGCGGDDGFVLLDRAARLQDPHLVAIRDRAAGRAVIIVLCRRTQSCAIRDGAAGRAAIIVLCRDMGTQLISLLLG